MATFYGLEIARRSLFLSQKGMEVTGHNIANANTKGYTRQSLVLKAMKPTAFSGTLTLNQFAQVGAGADIQELRQIRDSFVDLQYRYEYNGEQEWKAKAEALSFIEDIFNEPTDQGLSAVMTDFFNSLQELSKAPESLEIRTLVTQSAIKLTETIRYQRGKLYELQQQQDKILKIDVEEINNIIEKISDLNKQIFRYEIDGSSANDLRDTRNILLDQLSGYVDINYYENNDGYFRVDINGYPLVSHDMVNKLEVVPNTANPSGPDQLYTVRWKDTQQEVKISGGKLKGLLDIRDGADSDRMGVPYLIQQLDDFAYSIANEINAIHRGGYTIPEEGGTSKTGIDFFVVDGQHSAKTIRVSDDILQSAYNIAASSEPVDGSDHEVRGNNANIQAIINLKNRHDLPVVGGFDNFVQKIISELAVEASHTYNMVENQSILSNSLDNRRQSISGVSIDEEMVNMISYQHAYTAASRMITAIDQLLETLIKSTGIVGR